MNSPCDQQIGWIAQTCYFFMVENSMLFDGFVFVLWLIWGCLVGVCVCVCVFVVADLVLEDSERIEKKISSHGCQNRDLDRKITRFYDPTSPKRLGSH